MPTNCSAAKQLPQFCKHSKSADLLRKSLLSHVWRVPSSKALSCKHERLFDLLTLASLHSHVEVKCFLCGLQFGSYICTGLGNVGKCNAYCITCIIIECAGGVGRGLGCKINDLCINGISTVEINRYVVRIRLSCRCPRCKCALGDNIIIQLCATCECSVQEVYSEILDGWCWKRLPRKNHHCLSSSLHSLHRPASAYS